MSMKKRTTLILVTVLALALFVAGVSITAFADETENLAFKVTAPDGTVTEY